MLLYIFCGISDASERALVVPKLQNHISSYGLAVDSVITVIQDWFVLL